MPFTLFHFGPALFFGLLLFRHINFPTFLIANVIIDIEPFLVLFLGLDYPLHGFLHSFLGGSFIAIILYLLMTKLDTRIQKIMGVLTLKHKIKVPLPSPRTRYNLRWAIRNKLMKIFKLFSTLLN